MLQFGDRPYRHIRHSRVITSYSIHYTKLYEKKTGKVFTVGLEDRSAIHYYKLAEAVRNGAIGDLVRIEVGLPYKNWSYPNMPEIPVPQGFNYKMWLVV